MRKIAALCLLILPMAAQARQKAWGYCERGGRVVVTSGVSSTTRVQQSFPACTVQVNNTTGGALSVIFSDNLGTPKANPFTADANGYWFFYASLGHYDVTLSGGGILAPFTLGDIYLDDAGPGITTLNTLTGATQTFATGTAGTDFAIVSAANTHTFNIPTATATKRGLLSAANWTTFNAKESILTFNAPLSRVANAISLTPPLSIANGGTGQITANPAFNALAPTTTKGDLIVRNATVNTRLGIGTDTHVLIADAAQATGMKWDHVDLTAAVTGALPIANGGSGQTTQTAAFDALGPTTTKGDLVVHDGTNNLRLAVGATAGMHLEVDATQAEGIKWAVPTYRCRKDTVAYTNAVFIAASTTADVDLFTLAQFEKLALVTIKHSAQFSDGGGAMTDVSISIGKAGTVDFYTTPALSIGEVTAVADTAFKDSDPSKSGTMAAAGQAVVAHFIATARNFGDGAATFLTGGSVDVWSCIVKIQ